MTDRNWRKMRPKDIWITLMLKKSIFTILLFLFIVALVLYYRKEVMVALYSIHKSWSIAGFLCIIANYIFRALRLNILTERKLTIWPQGIYCTSMHGFLNYMLPLRSGDLSLPFLLKATANIELKSGALVLYKARLLEFVTLGAWITLASMIPFSNLPKYILVTMLCLGLTMMLAPFFLQPFLERLYLPFDRVRHFLQLLARTSRMTIKEIVITFAIWASIASCVGCIAKAMQLPVSLPEIAFLIALQLVMQLMPVQGLANSGNHESGWVAALMLMNYPVDQALRFALTSHAIILSYVLILGLIALTIKLAWIRKQN